MDLIKSITSDHELIELAKILNVKIDSIKDIREIDSPLPSKGTHLILLRAQDGVGHWVCVHDNEYFDPLGVGAPTKLGGLKTNKTQYQGVYSQYCGIFCMLWIYTKQHRKPHLLDGFHNLDIQVI